MQSNVIQFDKIIDSVIGGKGYYNHFPGTLCSQSVL